MQRFTRRPDREAAAIRPSPVTPVTWNPRELNVRERLYGVRHRIRRFRWELATGGRPLVRWFPRRWFTDPLALVDICSPWEVAWVTRHMASEYEGTGAIVELGSWLGAITTGMLHGLNRTPRGSGAVIHSYDLFVFDDIEQRAAGMPLEGHLHDGDSFLDLYRARLGVDAARVHAHVGDVMDMPWPREQQIEFLFNDVAKTWEIWNHLTSTFYAALQPGATVVEQDWAHACTPWLHLWHHRHRSHFEVLGQVPNAGSVAFRLISELPDEAFAPTGLADHDDAEIDAAFDWAATLVDPTRAPNVRAAFIQLYTLHGDLDRASRLCVCELAASRIDSELVTIALPVLAERLAAAAAEGQRP